MKCCQFCELSFKDEVIMIPDTVPFDEAAFKCDFLSGLRFSCQNMKDDYNVKVRSTPSMTRSTGLGLCTRPSSLR